MKGLESSIVVIVTTIVVLIVAVVLITIFGRGIAPVGSILEQANICRQQAVVSCSATGEMPPGWDTPFEVRNDNGDLQPTTCNALTKGIPKIGGCTQIL